MENGRPDQPPTANAHIYTPAIVVMVDRVVQAAFCDDKDKTLLDSFLRVFQHER